MSSALYAINSAASNRIFTEIFSSMFYISYTENHRLHEDLANLITSFRFHSKLNYYISWTLWCIFIWNTDILQYAQWRLVNEFVVLERMCYLLVMDQGADTDRRISFFYLLAILASNVSGGKTHRLEIFIFAENCRSVSEHFNLIRK